MRELKATVIFAVLSGLAVCSGCSKNNGSNPNTNAGPPRYTVSVAADKLAGDGLMLRNNGGDDLFITKNGSFKFKTLLADGVAYNVTVATQPTLPSQTCTVANGSGTIHGKNVTLVAECTTNKYTVGGTVTGLNGQVVLHNDVPLKPYDELISDASGSFTFDKEITDGKNYSVSVFRQPSVQTCAVSHGSGTLKGANVDDVAVSCVDNVPAISIQSVGVVEGDTGTGYLEFTVSLSLLARHDITVDYATSDGTATLADNDYTDTTGQLTIYAGTSSATIAVPVLGDVIAEQNETLALTLSNPSANATFGDLSVTSVKATGTIFNDDGGALNDTGITDCANADTNNLACNSTAADYPGQDADFGRDLTANDSADGHAGFSFVKYGNNGLPLAIQNVAWDATGSEAAGSQWSCVLDQTTELMWEVKTTDGGMHDKNWTYTWYNSNSSNNGGGPGTSGGGSCGATLTACDTEEFVAAMNADGLCGNHDWRLPTVEELSSLIDSSVSSVSIDPTVDVGWFPNTIKSLYWTSSPYASYGYYAWGVNFGSGSIIGSLQKQTSYFARLVRGGR